jgi:hypothetical protein
MQSISSVTINYLSEEIRYFSYLMISPGLVFRLTGIGPVRLLLFRYLGIVQSKCIRERKQGKNIEGEIEYLQLLKIGEVSQ